MQKISGKEISRNIVKRLKEKTPPNKFLAAILVGSDPTSINFLKQKEKIAKEIGVDFRFYKLSEEMNNDDLRKEIGRISRQSKAGGVIVQLPLPNKVNKFYVTNSIPREKDIDVLGERALGAFFNNRNQVLPPAVGVVNEILKIVDFDLSDKRVAVIGLGKLIGKPIGVWMFKKCTDLYLLDKGSDLEVVNKVDLIITGVGQADLISPKMLKKEAGVIDFGYYYHHDGKLSGDFKPSPASELKKLSFYTATPGGTGPILVAKLFENFYILNQNEK